jgi:hypothetical protein
VFEFNGKIFFSLCALCIFPLVDFGLQDLKSSFVVSVSSISADLFFGGGVAARSLGHV